MMDRFLRLASIVVIAAGVAACDDDVKTPVGETSTVNVSVYIENGAEDEPIVGATVSLDPVEDGATLTATTGADGVATFSNVPAGVYTATHSPATPITDATLTGSTERTVVAQFEGGTTNEAFVYSYLPGSISGVFFRDENDDDAYDPAADTTLAGFQAILFMGADTTDDAVESITVGDDGAFLFEGLAQGEYTILVRPILGTEVADSTVAVSVLANQTTDVAIEFTGGQAITDIAAARQLALGTVVTVDGVITASNEVFSASTAYMQDATGGIVIDMFGAPTFFDFALGDSVRVTGEIDEFNAELRVGGGTALEVEFLGTGTVPDPTVVTAAEVNAGEFQGELVQVVAVTVDSIDTGFNSTVWVSQGADDMAVFIDGTTGIDMASIMVGGTYDFTGVNSRFKDLFNDLFEVKPRSTGDIVLTSAPPGGVIDIALARVADGATVTITGVVTAGTGVYNGTTAYLQDGTGGIVLDQFGRTTIVPVAAGDSLTITGSIDQFNDEIRIEGGDAMTITSEGTVAVPAARSILAALLNAGAGQGELVVADSVLVLDVDDDAALGDDYEVLVEDESGSIVLFIDRETNIDPAVFTEGESYEITGVAARFRDLIEIKPRSSADVVGL